MRILASFLFFLLIVLQAKLWFGSHGVFQLWSLQNTIADARERNDNLSQRNRALHAEVKELKEGKEALEERARSQLGFIKDGETFYRVVPSNEADSDTKSAD